MSTAESNVRADDLVLDGTTAMSSKVGWYPERIKAWQRGERVAPVTLDVSLTRRCQAACIGPDELIAMADGSLKKMRSVKSGDNVLSYDGLSLTPSRVVKSWLSKPQANTISIVTDSGNVLRCTVDHRLLTPCGWVEAGQLCVGDELVTHEKTDRSDCGARDALEWSQAAATDCGREKNQARENAGLVEYAGWHGGARACSSKANSLQQRPGENPGATVADRAQTSWRETVVGQQDKGAFCRRTSRHGSPPINTRDIWKMPSWSDDGSGKGASSATNDRQHAWCRPEDERGEQIDAQRANGSQQPNEDSRSSGSHVADSGGAVRQGFLCQYCASLARDWQDWRAKVGNHRCGKSGDLGSHEVKQPNVSGRCRREGDDVVYAGASKGNFGQTEADLGGRQNCAADVHWARSSEGGEQDGVDVASVGREVPRPVCRRRDNVAADHDKRNQEESRLYFWERQSQDGAAVARHLLASGSKRCRSGDAGLLGRRLEPVCSVDKADIKVDAAEHRERGSCVVSRIVRIDDAGTSPVYDMECYPHHNFIASGVVVHNCSWCFAQSQASKGDTITKECFFSFLEDAAEIGVKGISFISDGESTLVDWYADAIVYAKRLGLAVGAGSNGIKLTRPLLEKILPHMTYLRFNFSAGEKARYSQIMGLNPHFFDDVIQNIKDGMEIIRRDNLKCSLNMQSVLDPRDGDQIIPFAKLACELRPVYAIIKHVSENDEHTFGIDYSKYAGLEDNLREAERLGREAGVRIAVKWDKIKTGWNRTYTRCYGANFLMQISGNGTVAPCGMKFNEKHKCLHIGSIVRTRFKDLWLSDRWKEVMDYIGSEHFNPQTRCGSLCLQHETCNYVYEYVKGRVSLPTTPPPRDIEFL